ncbi:polymer-forming cytoskeletal protein [Rhodoferax sp. U2-2l]|uniref:bactofilin family protein n=1 Tax=Rhodoferax sp. U2-2l TaxID=2884000 RepID=UPI001D0A985C|nr:polymer-forming cytoskeletal protein [Rhodoferax sp. U2-2l]MCB8746256.1 polymer-forming cytoskeletal protein [Rhodoferax sp. U2-2l]
MAMSPHFFNKRDETTTTPRHVVPLPQVPGYTGSGSAPAQSAANSATSGTGSASASVSTSPAASAVDAGASRKEGGSKLTVGPNIKLKGVEITDCDTLFVEGLVEATMDARLMEIAEPGAFKGSAEIDLAEIRGQFDGDLTVREKLVIYATGRVTGKIRYGKLVIEEGGQISGDIQFGASHSSKSAGASKQVLTIAG